MDLAQTLKARCDAIGVDPSSSPTAETIRLPAGAAPVLRATSRTLASDAPPGTSTRELPRISVELHGTLSTDGEARAITAARGDRDLEVIRTLGEGGMGRVFLARQHSLDREVAIKTVRDTALAAERAALLAEGAVVGSLEHPGVVPVHALGIDEEERPVLVMKRVEGAPWSDLLADPRHPAWEHLGGDPADRLEGHVSILMQVCSAAHFAHSRGIVHRDIKPQNVLVGRYGEVYLADWGLALRIEAAGAPQPLCGTPAYMAPEMVTGDGIDARTDVYLLGATLHQVLTGKARHAGSEVRTALMSAALSEPVDYPRSVPEPLARLANAATRHDREARPATAADVRQALAEYLRHRSSVALAESAAERLARLGALLADREALAREDRQRDIDVTAAEAGFALEQALREWSDNPVARRCAAELDALLGTRRSRAAELERFAREHDPAVSGRQKVVALAVVAVLGVGLSVSGLLADARAVTTASLFYQSLVPLAAVLAGIVIGRRALLTTALNRRIAANLLGITALIALNRGLALVAGVDAARVLVFDCVGAAVVCAIGAVVFFRWLGWMAALLLGAAAAAALAPERSLAAFSVATGTGLLLSVFFLSRSSRREAAGPQSTR